MSPFWAKRSIFDIVVYDLAGQRQGAVHRDLGVEQAVHGLSLGAVVYTEVAAEEQVGLAGFHRYAGGDAAAVQVPGARQYVVLGDHVAGGHGTGLAPHAQDPVHQHQRFPRQAHAGGIGVGRRELLAEYLGDGAYGEFQALLAGHENFTFRSGRRPRGRPRQGGCDGERRQRPRRQSAGDAHQQVLENYVPGLQAVIIGREAQKDLVSFSFGVRGRREIPQVGGAA